jgi:enoyl-[acyl-carrier protein] reductase I
MVESDKHPLRKSLSKEDVANSATFLVSDLNSAITGETIYVDCGANIMGYHVS